jgi:hypothetical protein
VGREATCIVVEDIANPVDAVQKGQVDMINLRHGLQALDGGLPVKSIGRIEIDLVGRCRCQAFKGIGDALQQGFNIVIGHDVSVISGSFKGANLAHYSARRNRWMPGRGPSGAEPR